MTSLSPAAMRRGEVLRADRAAFRRDGEPLSPRHVTSRDALARVIAHAATALDVLSDARHMSAMDPALLAARLSCDAYVLPPEYLRLRLRYGFRVFNNAAPILHERHVGHAGRDTEGRYVAAHHIGVMLHGPRNKHVLFSTLAPNTRDTTPVVIGVQADLLGEGLELRTAAQLAEDDLLDPMTLLVNPPRTRREYPAPIPLTPAPSPQPGHLPQAA